MHDSHGRRIDYLRLSLTSACQMRCTYCRPKKMGGECDADQLSAWEIETVVGHLVRRHGLSKVRLTGGDPTARLDLVEIIARLGRIPGIRDLAMTTHGLSLEQHASDYAAAGLHRVNISLDSLNPSRFARMTGVNGLPLVLKGIEAAMKSGLGPIRLNTVVLAGENEEELPQLVEFAADRGLEIRFIELMPMGPLADQWAHRYVPESAMWQRLNPMVQRWSAINQQRNESARRFRLCLHDGRNVTIGFITAMSCNFCAACNRLRLTADGRIYPCLMDQPRGSFMPAVRPVFDGDHLDRLLAQALKTKAPEHPPYGAAVMTTIGG